jgi:predicted RNase H-like HicB family nuclease
MHKYSFNVQWSDEDDAYVATVPEFPGLSAFGDTPDEAIVEAQTALEGFIEVYEEDGCPLPKPLICAAATGSRR